MRIVREIAKSSLFRITSLNSVSVILKIGIGLITSKVIAVFVGPSGMALVGNLRNFISTLETVSTLGFQNGIVKYVAENDSDKENLKKILSTVFISLIAVAIVLSGILFFLADFWNDTIFGSNFSYSFVFKALALALPWYACSIILLAVINGLSQFKEVIYITIAGNIIGLIVSIVMILQLHTFGALLAIIISPSLLFFVAFYFINKKVRLLNYISGKSFSLEIIKKMSGFSLMALVSSIILPLVFLVIRNDVIAQIGIQQAGYWEAITRISTYYLMFISTILVVYFLPKLVHAKNNYETKIVFWSYYKNIMPVFIIGLVFLFFLKEFVIQVLFTEDFNAVKDLFFWQLSGDVLKGFSLILGYNLVAKKQTIPFIITEFLSVLTLFLLSKLLLPFYGIEGIVMAHFFTYCFYLLILVIYFRKSLFNSTLENAV